MAKNKVYAHTLSVGSSPLTGALEDYLETIFLLIRDSGFAPVGFELLTLGIAAIHVAQRASESDLVSASEVVVAARRPEGRS